MVDTYNSKNGGIMFLHEREGSFGLTPVPKFYIEVFSHWDNGRSADDPTRACYKPYEKPCWILALDGNDEHANIAMKAYIESLRGVNDELVTDLLETFEFLRD